MMKMGSNGRAGKKWAVSRNGSPKKNARDSKREGLTSATGW